MDKPRVRVPAGSQRWAAPPASGPARRPARAEAGPAPYQTAGTGPRSANFRPGDYGPNAALANAATLRRQARQLRRNGGLAETVVNQLAKHIIGTGIVPELNDPAAQVEWERWTDVADADGLRDFYGLCFQAVEEMVEAGEVFARRRQRRPEDGLRVPMQIQLIAVEQLDARRDMPMANGLETRAGIQYNAIGQRTGYWFFRRHPGERGYDGGQSVLVPASEIIHLFHPKRAGQQRGITWLAPIIGAMRDVEDFQDSTRLREANNANFNLFIERNLPAQMDGEALMEFYKTVDARDAAGGTARVGLEPGASWILEPGEKATFANPPGVAGTYEPFMRDQKRTMATAVWLLYEQLSGDYSTGNDRTWRAAFNDFRRGIEALQHHTVVFMMLRRIMQWWGASARLSGVIGPEVETDMVPWTPQAWPHIHPLQDVQAAKAEVRAGFSSRRRFLRGRGERVEEIDTENAADRQREVDQKLVYDTDASRVSGSGVTQARPADSEIPDA